MLKAGVLAYPFSDKSGVLFYNTDTDESLIVDATQCEFNVSGEQSFPVLDSVSERINSILVNKGFTESD